MIESYVFQMVKDVLGPLYQKEQPTCPRQVRFAPQIEQIYKIVKLNFEKDDATEQAAVKYAERLSNLVLLDVIGSMNIEQLETFADGLFTTLWDLSCTNILSYKLNMQLTAEKFGDKLLQGLIRDAISKALLLLKREALAVKLADNLLEAVFHPTIKVLDNGLLEYANDVAENIVQSSLADVVSHNKFVKEVSKYAEETSIKVLKESSGSAFPSEKLAMAEGTAGKVASTMINSLFGDTDSTSLISNPRSSEQVHKFSEDMTDGILQSLNGNRLTCAHTFGISLPSDVCVIETCHATACHIPPLEESLNEAKIKSDTTNSSSSSLLAVNRRDSYDISSEALTPKSVVDEAGWKKGLYQFADQLLYSLSHLEDEPRIPDLCNSFDFATVDSRVRRSGSCPHILRIPSTVYETSTVRRQSESYVRFAGGMLHYAESLATNIVHSSFSEI